MKGASNLGTFVVIGLLIGAANLIGGCGTLYFARSRTHLAIAAALGTGLMIGAAWLIMAPGVVKSPGRWGLFVLIGFMGCLAIQRLGFYVRKVRSDIPLEQAWAGLLGASLHSFFEGAMLGAVMSGAEPVGLIATGALLIHKVSEGFGLSAVVLASTRSRLYAGAAPAVTWLATVLGMSAGVYGKQAVLVPHVALSAVAAGAFLFVGASGIMRFVARKGMMQLSLVILGALLAHASSMLFHSG